MKGLHFVTTGILLLFRCASCNAFQQGLSTSSTFKPSLRKKVQHGSVAVTSYLGRIQIMDRLESENSKFSFRGGGGSIASLNMMDPNLAGSISFSNAPLQLSSVIFTVTNSLGFLISVLTGSHLHLDLLGTGAFTLASLPTLLSSSSPTRVMISSGAVALWGAKLASFLCFRAFKVKTDTRLEETLSTIGGTGTFWFISLLWGLVCSLPHTLGTTSSSPGSPITLTIGSIIYLLGLATETKADFQKWLFKQNNPGKFCNEGLWAVSQHPNFFGNLILWFGIFIMNVDSLVEPAKESSGIFTMFLNSWRVYLSFLSPVFMWALFSGQASGGMTNSLELANKKYGSDPGYGEYLKSVPLIIPNIIDWLKKLFS